MARAGEKSDQHAERPLSRLRKQRSKHGMGKIGDVATEYATLKQAARVGQLSRRDLVRRGIALGIGGPALAGLLMSYRGSEVSAQAAEPAGPDAVKGKTYDMSILGIAGWPPSAMGVELATEFFKPYAMETLGYEVNFSFEESPFDQLFQKAAASLSTGAAEFNSIIDANPELQIEFEEAAAIGYRIYPDGSDQIWGFPQEADTIALFVRQDLFSDQAERDAFKAANGGMDLPQTFEDWEAIDMDTFETIAAHFNRPDDGLAGTSFQ